MRIQDVFVRTEFSNGTVMRINAAMDVDDKEKMSKLMEPGFSIQGPTSRLSIREKKMIIDMMNRDWHVVVLLFVSAT